MNLLEQQLSEDLPLRPLPYSHATEGLSTEARSLPMASTRVQDMFIFGPLSKKLESGDLGAGWFMDFVNWRLRAAVERSREANRMAVHACAEFRAFAFAHNEQIEPLIASIESESLATVLEYVQAIKSQAAETDTALKRAAEKQGKVGVLLEPTSRAIKDPRAAPIPSREAITAKLQILPSGRSGHFLSPKAEVWLAIFIGAVIGLCLAAAGQQISLDALGTEPVKEIGVALFGMACAVFGSKGVQNFARFGRNVWDVHGKKGAIIFAGLVATVFVAIEALINQQGMMASQAITDAVAKLSSGTASSSGSSGLVYLAVGCFSSLAYFTYHVAKGWCDSEVAECKISLGYEEAIRELHEKATPTHAWLEAVVATNALTAERQVEQDLHDRFGRMLGILHKESNRLRQQLLPISYVLSPEWNAIVRGASDEVRKTQEELDALWEPLVRPIPKPSTSVGVRPGQSWIAKLLITVWPFGRQVKVTA